MTRSAQRLTVALMAQAVSGFCYFTATAQPVTSWALGLSSWALIYCRLRFGAEEHGRGDATPHPLAFLFFLPLAAGVSLVATRGWLRGGAWFALVCFAILICFNAGVWLGFAVLPVE